MIDAIGGRKVVVGIVVILVGIGAVFFKGDIPANFLDLLKLIFGAFVLGNGLEHVAGAISERTVTQKIEGGAALTQAAPDYSAALAELKSQNEATQGAVVQALEASNTIQQTLGFIIKKTKLDQ